VVEELKLIDGTVVAIDSSKIYANGKVQEGQMKYLII